jgi:hypothetical protein
MLLTNQPVKAPEDRRIPGRFALFKLHRAARHHQGPRLNSAGFPGAHLAALKLVGTAL